MSGYHYCKRILAPSGQRQHELLPVYGVCHLFISSLKSQIQFEAHAFPWDGRFSELHLKGLPFFQDGHHY